MESQNGRTPTRAELDWLEGRGCWPRLLVWLGSLGWVWAQHFVADRVIDARCRALEEEFVRAAVRSRKITYGTRTEDGRLEVRVLDLDGDPGGE